MEGGDQETAADLARMPGSDSEQPDPAAACAGMAPYLGDIDRYMRSLELEVSRRPRGDYMWTIQKDIRPDMRAVLVDWLVEVAQDFGLPSDALHLAVSYVDRFLSATVLSQEKLQLLGVTALLVAAKYEDDIFLHEIEKYAEVTDNTYTRQQVVKMEIDILKFLNYEMGSPTARTFLQRHITACHGGDREKAKKLELLDYECIRFNPSVVAAACLFVARFTISPTTRPWNLTLQRKTGYKVSDLKPCIFMIHGLQLNGTYPGLEEKGIKDKYNVGEIDRVSAMDPPQRIPAYFLKDIEPLKGQGALATPFAAVAVITNSFVSRLQACYNLCWLPLIRACRAVAELVSMSH